MSSDHRDDAAENAEDADALAHPEPTHEAVADGEVTRIRKPVPEPAPLAIPKELGDPELTLYTAAVLLSRHGWRIVPTTSVPTKSNPTKAAHKHPGGLLGKGWQHKATRDLPVLSSWFLQRRTTSGFDDEDVSGENWYRSVPFDTIGLGIVADHAIILDIDTPDDVPDWVWPYLEQVPFQSTSAVDGRRGHYFFLSPADKSIIFRDTAHISGVDGKGSPGEIRHGNAIIASAPSAHQKSNLGRRYQYMRFGQLQEMPQAVAEWAGRIGQTQSWSWNGSEFESSAVTLTEVNNFIEDTHIEVANEGEDQHQQQIIERHIDWMVERANKIGLHPIWLAGLIDLVQFALCGYVQGLDVLEQSEAAFVALRSSHDREAMGGNYAEPEAAREEHNDLVTWALGRVQAKLDVAPEATHYEAYDVIRTFYTPNVNPIARPKDYVVPSRTPRQLFHPKETTDEDGTPLVHNTDVDIAQALAPSMVESVRWITDQRIWFAYDRDFGVWETVGEFYIERLVSKALSEDWIVCDSKSTRNIPASMHEVVDELMGAFGLTNVIYVRNTKRAKEVPQVKRVVEALKMSQELWSKTSEFNTNKMLLPVANGTLDLQTLSLHEFSHADMVTSRMPTPYVPGATCPNWERFIFDAIHVPGEPEKRARSKVAFIQEFFAAALKDDWASQVQGFLFVHGPAGSGKSTVFEVMPKALFGENTTGMWSVGNPTLVTKAMQDTSRKFELAMLYGKRLITFDEAFDSASGVDQGFLKQITSGGSVSAAQKFQPNFPMVLGHSVFVSNNMPKLSGFDTGIRRRMFTIKFPHEHEAGASDPTLFERLLRPELPGILLWIVEGMRRLATTPDTIKAAAASYETVRQESEHVLDSSSAEGEFFQHLVVRSSDGSFAVAGPDLYNLYRDYISATYPDKSHISPLIHREFYAALEARFNNAGLRRTARGNYMQDNGQRRRAAVYTNLFPKSSDAFMVRKDDDIRGAGIGKTKAVRDRIGIPMVEEWRQRMWELNRPTMGTPLQPVEPIMHESLPEEEKVTDEQLSGILDETATGEPIEAETTAVPTPLVQPPPTLPPEPPPRQPPPEPAPPPPAYAPPPPPTVATPPPPPPSMAGAKALNLRDRLRKEGLIQDDQNSTSDGEGS